MSNEREKMALPAGTEIASYRIIELLSSWGFFLSYLAEPKSGGARLVLLELMPEELVLRNDGGRVESRTDRNQESFRWARDRFLMEFRGLAACAHPNITEIREVFEANGTAYAVMRYEDGRSVKRWLQELGRSPTETELQAIFFPALDALQTAHARGLFHLNLKPETIQLASDGRPVLAHFAGARQAIAEHTLAASAITPGYSPPEQYDDRKPAGAWSDFYGLAAVMHRAIAGQPPPEAILRLKSDPYEKLAKRFAGQYSERFLIAMDAALAPDPVARPQSADEWLRMLGRRKAHPAVAGMRAHPIITGVSIALAAILLVALWTRPKPIHHEKEEDKKEQDQKTSDKKETEKNDNAKEEAARKEEADKKELAKKEEAEKIDAAKKEAEKQEAEKLEAAKKAEAERMEAAKKVAEEKDTGKPAAAKLEAEKLEAAKKEAARIEAEKQEIAKREAARLEAEKQEIAKKEAARMEAEKLESAKKEAEKLAAARKEEEKKKDAETPGANVNTPPPSSGPGYMSPMFVGVWESKSEGTQNGRRLEIKGNGHFVISGEEPNSGVMNAVSGIINFSAQTEPKPLSGTYKLKSLGKMIIDAPVIKGEWTRVQATATPSP